MRVKPKKSLGQNFLIDGNILKKLIACYGLKKTDRVLEIGAGLGALTKLLAQKCAFVYALEVDRSLCALLSQNVEGYANIEIINRDILKFDLDGYPGLKNKIKVVGNIPYYITTPIIEYLFNFKDKIESVFLTVQKEFGKRIAAGPGSKEYGSFSVFVQYYAAPEIHFFIKRGSFFPRPKVDSCLVELKLRQKPQVYVKDEGLFFRIVRAAFNQRRKVLKNSLNGIVGGKTLDRFFEESGVNKNARPENLSLVNFALLANQP